MCNRHKSLGHLSNVLTHELDRCVIWWLGEPTCKVQKAGKSAAGGWVLLLVSGVKSVLLLEATTIQRTSPFGRSSVKQSKLIVL